VAGQECSYLIFTSGSTGDPKGSWGRWGAWPTSSLAVLHHRTRRRILAFAPFGFDVSIQELLYGLTSGGSVHVATQEMRSEPWALVDYVEQHAIEVLTLPFSALVALADAAQGNFGRLSSSAPHHLGRAAEDHSLLRSLLEALPDLRLHISTARRKLTLSPATHWRVPVKSHCLPSGDRSRTRDCTFWTAS